jgi:hypothetical protein
MLLVALLRPPPRPVRRLPQGIGAPLSYSREWLALQLPEHHSRRHDFGLAPMHIPQNLATEVFASITPL